MASVKRVSMLVLAGSLILPLVACDKLGGMMGKKDDAAQQQQQALQAQQDQKMKDLEAKVQQMEAEAKARKEAEERAKAEEELKAKIAAEVKAQNETQPTAPTAAVTTPTTQATTPPPATPEPPKVVERVIIKEVPAKTPAPAATPSAPPAAKASGYVRLYDDAGFTDRSLTIRFGRDVGNMHYVSSDDGKAGFNDKASSVKYSVPAGWQAVLYENNNYSKRGYALKGAGSIPDLGYFGDKCSSVRWERAGE
jgi:outer membrane murein-binding lipoprotein Lpp